MNRSPGISHRQTAVSKLCAVEAGWAVKGGGRHYPALAVHCLAFSIQLSAGLSANVCRKEKQSHSHIHMYPHLGSVWRWAATHTTYTHTRTHVFLCNSVNVHFVSVVTALQCFYAVNTVQGTHYRVCVCVGVGVAPSAFPGEFGLENVTAGPLITTDIANAVVVSRPHIHGSATISTSILNSFLCPWVCSIYVYINTITFVFPRFIASASVAATIVFQRLGLWRCWFDSNQMKMLQLFMQQCCSSWICCLNWGVKTGNKHQESHILWEIRKSGRVKEDGMIC